MNLLNLFKTKIAVKPIRANDDDAGWMVIHESPIEAFIDEVLRYGWSTAIYNLRVQMGWKHE